MEGNGEKNYLINKKAVKWREWKGIRKTANIEKQTQKLNF